MSHLTFMMGEFEAEFPQDRLYASNHMWGKVVEVKEQATASVVRFGFSAYAVRLLQDVYFLDWDVDCPSSLRVKQQIGSIESKKAESDLFSPLDGQLIEINQKLLTDPSMINLDKYGDGWLFAIAGDPGGLMPAEQYIEHLTSVWEITQRTIKGQLNE